jgi:hypothetical protein
MMASFSKLATRAVFGGVLVFGVVAVGAYVAPRREANVAPASVGEGHFRAGTVSTYALTYRTSNTARLGTENAGPLSVAVAIDGTLRVSAFTSDSAASTLGLRLTDLRRAELTAPGQGTDSVLRDELVAADATLSLDANGAAVALAFSDTTTVRARRVLRGLYLELGAQLVAARSGVSEVETAAGRARVTATLVGDTRTVHRTGYVSLDAFPEGFSPAVPRLEARDEVRVDERDDILSTRTEENLEVEGAPGAVRRYLGHTQLGLERVAVEARELGEAPRYRTGKSLRDIGELSFDREASLERRSKGVTFETVMADLATAAAAPRAGITEWIWHDTAWLELHPSEGDRLLVDAAEKDRDVRRTAFELLVATGTPEAQSTLVRDLERGRFLDADERLVLLQRLSYLKEPSPPTRSYVANVYAKSRHGSLGFAAAHTLGALAAAVSTTDADAAEALVAPLVEDLSRTASTDERIALVHALGNAGLSGTERAVVPYAGDPDPALRQAVARSLRRTEESATETLLALAADEEPLVAEAALDSLFRKELSESDWAALARIVDKDEMPRLAQGRLVTGLGEHLASSPKVPEILVRLLASPRLDQRLVQQVEGLLRSS